MHNIAIKYEKGPTIMLASGTSFDFLNPDESSFTIEDIAHALSLICRYSGQCRRFYSVAEHSILVSETVDEFKLEALMHDAAEAFLGDITRPLKQLLPDFRVIEKNVERAVMKRFDLDPASKAKVKQADLRILAAEQRQVMAAGCADWALSAGVKPAEIELQYLAPEVAEHQFLNSFEKYLSRRNRHL